jgi:tRNA1(Val) A37 N6-methylase TrmN6
MKGKRMIRYKVVETSVVTDEALEEILNEWTAQGWHLDSIQFVVREASKRPAMAFVLFTRTVEK